jgi:hypothetical protein
VPDDRSVLQLQPRDASYKGSEATADDSRLRNFSLPRPRSATWKHSLELERGGQMHKMVIVVISKLASFSAVVVNSKSSAQAEKQLRHIPSHHLHDGCSRVCSSSSMDTHSLFLAGRFAAGPPLQRRFSLTMSRDDDSPINSE